MLRAIYRDQRSDEVVVRGDILYATIETSKISGAILVELHYGYDPIDYVNVYVGDKDEAESILKGASVSGTLNFKLS